MPRAEAPSSGARALDGNIPRPSLNARIRTSPTALTEIGIAAFYPSIYSRLAGPVAEGTKDVAFLDDAVSLSI
jgi:hypothetical protein